MKNVNEIVYKAPHYFKSYNCAEGTLLMIAKGAFETETEPIPKVATGFGGGHLRQ